MKMFRRYISDRSGAVTVESAFLTMLMVALTGGIIEAGYAYHQWNGVQQAARHGARLAATSDPVALEMNTMTGIGGGVVAGDPMPDYDIQCSGKTQSCSEGGYDNQALDDLLFGPDGDDACGATDRLRRGMCDLYPALKRSHIDIAYTNSGLGRAGFPAQPAPLVTVTVQDQTFDFVFLNLFLPKKLENMPPVTASYMGEDLRSGA